ncbi:nucleic acid-binding, OB-fold protein [Tanacetum coccineum]
MPTFFSDYIGCLRSTGSISDFGDPNRRQGARRKIKIENLNGNIVECTLWDEMANHFGEADIHSMEQPSQLLCNFKARYKDTSLLTICKYPHKDVQQDKTRNRFPLKTIMDQNPQSYKGVRFTAEATITAINMNKDWYYISCNQCGKATIANGDDYSCLDHGPQPGPFFRYKFKGYITDNTATAPITFFTPAVNKVTDHPCTELVEKYKPANLTKIPPEILAAQGKHDAFQFHFNTLGNLIDLSLDDVYDVQKQDQQHTGN